MADVLDLTEVKATEPTAEALRKNVTPKLNVKPKSGTKVGEVAHYHKAENETEIWDEPCLLVEHTINFPGGITYCGEKYTGRVIVARCVADYLASQESMKRKYEEGIFRSKQINRFLRNM
jgi:hypothetical protein